MAKASKKTQGRTQNVIGIILAVLSLVAFPPILGIISIALGYWGSKKGDKKLGKITMILGIVFAIIGMFIGWYLSTYAGA